MTDVASLVADRLLALDTRRARVLKPKRFAYMGPREPGRIALFSTALIAEFYEGDPVPEGAKHVADSAWALQRWYKERTKVTPTGLADRWLTKEEYLELHSFEWMF